MNILTGMLNVIDNKLLKLKYKQLVSRHFRGTVVVTYTITIVFLNLAKAIGRVLRVNTSKKIALIKAGYVLTDLVNNTIVNRTVSLRSHVRHFKR